MESIFRIIEAKGGWEKLKTNAIKVVTGPGFMPLCIEQIGTGPRGGVLVSIAHYYEQCGDLMRDPDLVVEVFLPAGPWLPVSFRQDGLGIYQEAVRVEDGRLLVKDRLVKDLQEFMRTWDLNIAEQGFVAAAQQ